MGRIPFPRWRFGLACLGLLGLLSLMLSACDTETPAPPTPTFPVMAASPTVAPVVPSLAPTSVSVNVGEQNFTPGAPALSQDNPVITVTPTPAPTQASIPLQFIADDGLTLVATYFAASTRPAPAVLVLASGSEKKEDWALFAAQLQTSGRNVVVLDVRGTGETGGQLDLQKATADIALVLTRVATLPGVDGQRISLVGTGSGANLALAACANATNCPVVIMLSPDPANMDAVVARLGKRALLIAASKGDQNAAKASQTLDKLALGDHRLALYDGTRHGLVLVSGQADLTGMIIDWLRLHRS